MKRVFSFYRTPPCDLSAAEHALTMAAADIDGPPPRKKARKSTQSEDGAPKQTLEEAQAAVEKQQQKDTRKKAVKYNRGPQTKLKVRIQTLLSAVSGFDWRCDSGCRFNRTSSGQFLGRLSLSEGCHTQCCCIPLSMVLSELVSTTS